MTPGWPSDAMTAWSCTPCACTNDFFSLEAKASSPVHSVLSHSTLFTMHLCQGLHTGILGHSLPSCPHKSSLSDLHLLPNWSITIHLPKSSRDPALSFVNSLDMISHSIGLAPNVSDGIIGVTGSRGSGAQRPTCQLTPAQQRASPLVAGAPVEVQPDELQLSFQMQRQAAFDAVPLDPRSCPGPGVKLCTYRRWFSRPAHQVCPVYWEVPMSTAKLQRILRFRMGSHLLPIEQGRHLRLPRHRRVCRLCHTGALGDERHMLLECPALADLRDEYSPLVAECSGVMARLVWARNQPMVSRYIIACLDRMSC